MKNNLQFIEDDFNLVPLIQDELQIIEGGALPADLHRVGQWTDSDGGITHYLYFWDAGLIIEVAYSNYSKKVLGSRVLH